MRKRITMLLLATGILLSGLWSLGSSDSLDQINRLVAESQTESADPIKTDMRSLTSLYRFIDSFYYEDVDYPEVAESIAEAMLDALNDPYSFYVRSSEAEEFQQSVSGIYSGIGIVFTKRVDQPESLIEIQTVYNGTPAQRAGLMSRDKITEIDGESVKDLSSSECALRIRGEKGTEVTLTFQRGDAVYTITLVRDEVSIPVVYSGMVDDHIGVIAISNYTSDVSLQFEQALAELKSEGMTALIIDERDNGGGSVAESLKIANMLLPPGRVIVTMQGNKNTDSDETYRSSGPSSLISEDMPIALIINGGSASASEILAAALKDNERASLVGEKSFGKGIYQTYFPFRDGYVQLTTGHYYTPSGTCIHEIGIEPDYEAESITVKEEQVDAYIKLIEENKPALFIEAHPEFSSDMVNLFADQYESTGIDRNVLALLIISYYRAEKGDEVPLIHPEFDPPMAEAISVIRGMR